jgi:hypothetical protein
MFAAEVITPQRKAAENPNHRPAPRPSTQARSKPCDDRKRRVPSERVLQQAPRRAAKDFDGVGSLSSDEARPSFEISPEPPVGCTCAACEGTKSQSRHKEPPGPSGGVTPAAEGPGTGGRPLEATARAFFEPRLGHDLSRVRVHADRAAGVSALDAGARAYTVGHNIVFAPGHYAPSTSRGRSLLAHELVHVTQQTQGHPAASSGHAHEKEADGLSASLAAGRSIRGAAITPAAPSIARAPAPYVSPYNEALAREMYARMVAFRAEQGATGGFERQFVVAVGAVFDEQGKRIGWFERMNVPGAAHAEEVVYADIRALAGSGQKIGYTVLMVDQDPCLDICRPLLKTWAGDPVTGSLRVVTPMRVQARDPNALTTARTAHKQLRTQDTVHVEPKAPPPNREAFLASREETRIRLPQYREPKGSGAGAGKTSGAPDPAPAPNPAGKVGGDVEGKAAKALAQREEGQVAKAATDALGATAAKRLTQVEEKALWEKAAESFTALAAGTTARRLAQASTPVIGAAFAAPDVYRGGQDIAHGNIVMGAGTIGVAIVDIAAQGLHLTDEFTAGGGTALALTIQAWCTAMQMGFEMARVGARAKELQAYIQAHNGGLPPRDQLMGYYGLNDEDILLLENDLRKAAVVTTADVIARVQALIAEIDSAANKRSDADPAAVIRERDKLGRLLAELKAFDAAQKQQAAQASAAAAERARQQRLDAALHQQQAAAHPTPAQQKAAAGALLPGPGGPATGPLASGQQGLNLGPFFAQPPPSLSGMTMENAELAGTWFGRERTRLLQRYAQLDAAHFPDGEVKSFQAAVAKHVEGLDMMINLFTSKGSAAWAGVQEMKRLRNFVDNEDRNRLMR